MATDHNDIVSMLLKQTSELLANEHEANVEIEVISSPQAEDVSEIDSLTSTTEATTTQEVPVYASTYNPDDFGGIPEPECWRDVRDCFNAGIDKILLYGAPGIGKTYAGLFYGDVSRGAERLICTEDMTTADVGGCMLPTAEGGFAWHDGAALRDRFSCAIQVNAPHPAALMRFPENQRMLAATLVAGKPGQRVSLRQMQYFNQLLQSSAFTVDRAARLAFSEHMAKQIVQSLQIGTLSVDVSL